MQKRMREKNTRPSSGFTASYLEPGEVIDSYFINVLTKIMSLIMQIIWQIETFCMLLN